MNIKRRKFLEKAGLLVLSSLVPIGLNGWIAKAANQSQNRQNLIVILLRGGLDGLSVLVPHQDANYYQARPNVALAIPKEKDGVIDLDGYFGINPSLEELMPLWRNKTLAFVHNCGMSNYATRSHFDAQYFIENGTPGIKATPDGWLNRLLAILPQDSVTQAINFGNLTPLILSGKMPVANLPVGKEATNQLPIDQPQIQELFDRLYAGKDPLSMAYQEGRRAREIIKAELETEMIQSSQGDQSANSFAKNSQNLAKLIKGNAQTQIAFIGIGAWDTHIGQKALLGRSLSAFGQGLTKLVQELGSAYQDTVIVVMSEFGRTVQENGNRGTDHGHGNIMWLLGGSLKGGQLYGKWSGLEESDLYEGRDLPVNTDFREVILSVLDGHLQINSSQFNRIFPGYQFRDQLSLV